MLKREVKTRLDLLLLERGLADTREKAKALIMAGQVLVEGSVVDKAGMTVRRDAELQVARPLSYVGRGGVKLAHALEEFGVSVEGKVALDVGASTGGFTDCLLQRGAQRVYALDVGRGQLDYRIRTHPQVVVMERVNARYPFELPERVDVATVDVSFISVTKVLPSVASYVKGTGFVIALLKPQFEALRSEVGKRGVIKDPLVHARVLGRFIRWVANNGFRLRGLTASPILGDAGNREFFFRLEKDEG